MTSDQPDPSDTVIKDLEQELESFFTLQQQFQNTDTLAFHHLSQSISSSESSNPASTVEETPVDRVLKRNHPQYPNTSPPRTPRLFLLDPQHNKTKEFLKHKLPIFHNTPFITLMTTNKNF